MRFFRHNRLNGRLHSHDTVTGPMPLNPNHSLPPLGEAPIIGGQQTSWHTQRAVDILWNALVR
jgi:hypothetical protein